MPSSSPVPAVKDMRRVWLLFLGFCLPLLLGWAGLEWVLAKVPNSFSAKRDELQPLSGNVDTIILGSSEAFFGISPHKLSGSAFNLANNAQTLYYDYEIMKRVLPKLPRLKRVIVQIDYVSLYSELYDNTDSWRQYGYYQEWYIPLQRPIDYWNVRLFSRAALYKTLSALLDLAKGRRMNFATCVDDRGWCDAPKEWSASRGDAAARQMIIGNHSNMHEEHIPANTAVLEQLLAMLRGLRRAGAVTRFFFSVYEPEIHLFGGLAAMQLVHRHFDADTIAWMELDNLAQAGQRTTLPPDAISNAVLNDLFLRTIADRFEVWDVWRNLAALNDAQRFGCNEPSAANDIASLVPRLSVTEARTLHRYARANSTLADGLRRLNDGGRLHVGLRGLLPFIAMFHLNRHGYDQARQANLTLAMCRAWDPHAGLHGFAPDSPNAQTERAE